MSMGQAESGRPLVLVRLALKAGLPRGFAGGRQPQPCFSSLKGCGTNNSAAGLIENP